LQLVIGAEPPGTAKADDPNAILFLHGSQAQFAALRDYLLGVVARNRELGIDPSTVPFDPPAKTRLQKLEDVQAQWEGKVWSYELPASQQAWGPPIPAAYPTRGLQLSPSEQGAVTPPAVPATASQPVEQRPMDVATRLQQLEQLKTAGVITEVEYAEKRAAILADL
jgi:hypothetical protein